MVPPSTGYDPFALPCKTFAVDALVEPYICSTACQPYYCGGASIESRVAIGTIQTPEFLSDRNLRTPTNIDAAAYTEVSESAIHSQRPSESSRSPRWRPVGRFISAKPPRMQCANK